MGEMGEYAGMTKFTQPLMVFFEVSSLGGHNFYCVNYAFKKAFEGAQNEIIVTVLSEAVNKSSMYNGAYDRPETYTLVGDGTIIGELPEPKMIEVRK